jgi:hypothetical protein
MNRRRIFAAISAGEQDRAKLATLGDEPLKASGEELQRALKGRAHPALISGYISGKSN